MADTLQKKQLVQAVNTAARRIAMQRESLAYGSGFNGALDNKRLLVWKEYGFPNVLRFDDFLNLYERNGLASAIVHRISERCWYDEPWLVEGSEEGNKKRETPWEREFRKLAKQLNIWQKFEDADKRRMVGSYAGLILQVAEENPNWQTEMESGAELIDIIPAWQGQLLPTEWDTRPDSKTYGKVTMWQYQEAEVESADYPPPGRSLNIHHSRVVIVGDYREGKSLLEPPYNDFVSLEKVTGGVGESYAKNASRQMNFQYDKETTPQSLADAAGVPVSELSDALNDMVSDLNQGLDAGAFTFGGKAVPMVANVPDPREPADVLRQNICASARVPMKVVLGSQDGERASTEDEKNMNNRCQGRRKSELTHDITRFITHLMEYRLIPPVREFTVMWTDLAEASFSDKLANVKSMAEAMKSLMGTGVTLFTADELREVVGYEPLDEGDLPPEGFEDE